jgi:hypothetical protein
MTRAATFQPRRELAHRVSGGLEITLDWWVDDNSTRHRGPPARLGRGHGLRRPAGART